MAREKIFKLKSGAAEAAHRRDYWEHVIAGCLNPEAEWARMEHASTEIKFYEHAIEHYEKQIRRVG